MSTIEPDPIAPAGEHPTRVLADVEGITKSFPGLVALDDVSLDVRGGEILAIIGHNGSGKSTLVKVLAGIYRPDAGTIALHTDAEGSTELHFIHQDLGLIPELTAAENLHLGRTRALSPVHRRVERERTRNVIARFGEAFDIDVPVGSLSPAQRAIVAIARALSGWTHARNVLVLDEPTEALHRGEVDVLFSSVRRVAAEGAGVVFISHRLDEVLELADRVVVLRDGRKVADEATARLDHDRLVHLVTGTDLGAHTHRDARTRTGRPMLRVRGLRGERVRGFDLDLFPGETVGIAGVLGSGREEVPSLLFGAEAGTADEVVHDGRAYPHRSPAESIRRGLAYVAGDRARYGAIGQMSARENMTLPRLGALRSRAGAIRLREERVEASRLAAQFEVRPASIEQRFGMFSGGNQQKIVMAKWLRNRPSVLLLEEPTQGVDIGAKAAIYSAIDHAGASGAAVLVCSSDAKELVRLCDRVLVLRDGRVVAELSGDALSEHRLILEGYGLADVRPEPDVLASSGES